MTFFQSAAIQTHLELSYCSASETPRQTRSPILKKYDFEHHLDAILAAASVSPLVEPCMDRLDAATLAISKLEKAGGAAPSPAVPRAMSPAASQPARSVWPGKPKPNPDDFVPRPNDARPSSGRSDGPFQGSISIRLRLQKKPCHAYIRGGGQSGVQEELAALVGVGGAGRG
jgi:hypothetical protein